jgi:hypothetical protein
VASPLGFLLNYSESGGDAYAGRNEVNRAVVCRGRNGAKISDERAAGCQHVLGEDLEAVAARIFHGVHRGVGFAKELFGTEARFGIDGDPDAEGNADFATGDANWMSGVANDLVAATLDVVHGAEIGHNDDEFVATHPGDGVGLADRGEQALSDGGEQDVAVGVPSESLICLKLSRSTRKTAILWS